MPSDPRYIRQQEIVPPHRLGACRATVIGVGAIGRQVAIQLAAMGIPALQLVDFDTVEPSNLASQGYLEADLGRPKVEATAAFCRRLRADLELEEVNGRFRRGLAIGEAVFCCVDRIQTRGAIWRAVEDRCAFFSDGRMAAEVLRVVTACDAAGREHYPGTLFAAAEAHAGPCTARATIYSAAVAAGLMLSQFTRHLRGLPVDADVQMNLLTSELTVCDGPVVTL